jgi:hypothetical protein
MYAPYAFPSQSRVGVLGSWEDKVMRNPFTGCRAFLDEHSDHLVSCAVRESLT